ncbi:MAG: ethylbenzene dehydrogenase-related protein [Candidatus Brocadiaceae bacterium]|nr:ethylbenzene dehydrogenase-related protein [Candidatus Brocadiaceae bacterium]
MEKLFCIVKRYGVALFCCFFLSATLYAADEAEGVKGIAEEEYTPTEEVLEVNFVQVEMPYHMSVKAMEGAFKNAEPVTVKLQEQDKAFPNGGGSVKSADVKAVHDGITIYFQISWDDRTKDVRQIAIHEFRDAVALMFPLGKVVIGPVGPAEHFSPRMGDREKPVNLWHWKADWEGDLVAKDELEDIDAQYPNWHDDFNTNPYSVNYHKGLISSPPILSGGRAVHNLLSMPGRKTVVEDLNAEGFGTLTTQDHQDVNGCSNYENGRWTVVVYRPLITDDPYDVQFIPGESTYFNMAVWNGSRQDRNGQKSLSMRWNPLRIGKIAWE